MLLISHIAVQWRQRGHHAVPLALRLPLALSRVDLVIWVWVKIKLSGDRRFYPIVHLPGCRLGVPMFDPQPPCF